MDYNIRKMDNGFVVEGTDIDGVYHQMVFTKANQVTKFIKQEMEKESPSGDE